MSETIGQNIRQYRTEIGITQEELGRRIGITTQAVSKWERGGTPDAEILPLIAEALGVTIDQLFGHRPDEKLETGIIRELSALDQSKAFRRAFELCWSIEMGLTGNNSLKEKFTSDMLHSLQDEFGNEYFSRLITDGGLVSARVSRDAPYYFLMPEPENGYEGYLTGLEKNVSLFSLLADTRILKIIVYLYSRRNTPVSLSMIAAKTGLPVQETEECMQALCHHRLAEKTTVETEDQIICAYTYSREHSLLPLLVYAREIGVEHPLNYVALFLRNKPLFQRKESNE